MLLKEYDINWPHGGAVINAQTRDFGKATPLDTVSPIDLKFDTHVQLRVIYKKASWTTKVRLTRFSAILNFLKNTFLTSPPKP